MNLTEIVAVHGATAHPHFDRDGSYHNLGSLRDTTGPKYAVVKITPDRKGKAHALIPPPFVNKTGKTCIGNGGRITKYIHVKSWDIITYPCRKFDSGLVKALLNLGHESLHPS